MVSLRSNRHSSSKQVLLLFTTSWLEVSLVTGNIMSVRNNLNIISDFVGYMEVSDPQPAGNKN